MAHVCLHSRKRVHTRLSEKDRTQRLARRNRGLPSLDHSAALCRQRNTLYSATLLYTYISRFSVNPHYQQGEKIRQNCRHSSISNCFLTSRTNGLCSFSQVKAGTHSASLKESHTATHTPKQGAFRMGRYHYPRHVLHVHEHPRAGYQNGVLYRFWGLVVGAPKERREPSGQRCAYARRCSAAPRPRWAA